MSYVEACTHENSVPLSCKWGRTDTLFLQTWVSDSMGVDKCVHKPANISIYKSVQQAYITTEI